MSRLRQEEIMNSYEPKRNISSALRVAGFFLLAICYTLISNFNCFAQDITVTARLDKQVITMEEMVVLTITISGAKSTNQPTLPPLEGLVLEYGPSTSSQTRIENSKVTKSCLFGYVLSPLKPGKYTIGPVSLDYKGKTYSTEPVQVEVASSVKAVKRGNKSSDQDLDKGVFIEIDTDKKEAYIYEQITLTFKLYLRRGLNIDDLDYIKPAVKNFLSEALGEQKNYDEVRGDVVYHVVELRTALFPVMSGELTVPPATFNCNLLIRQNNRQYNPFFDEFFGASQSRQPITRKTEPITITVKPFPEKDKPSDFNGAVGSYTMNVSTGSTNVKAGDPITLNIKVSGNGYVHTIREPSLDVADNFKVYSAESSSEITGRSHTIKGWKKFTTVIEPLQEDVKEIPVMSLSFFDPDTAEYKTLTYGPIPITVQAADERIPIQLTLTDGVKSKEQARVLKKDILPLMTNLLALSNQGDLLFRNRIFYGLLSLPLISVIALVIIQQRSERYRTDLGYARKKKALSSSKSQLAKARRLTEQSEFYSIVSKTLCEYIADKQNVPAASITSDNVSVKLGPSGVSSEIIEELKRCLETCDSGRFSNEKKPEHELHNILESAEKLIKQLEKKL